MLGATILKTIMMVALGLMLSACVTLRGEASSRPSESASNNEGGLFGGFGFGRSSDTEEEAPEEIEEEGPVVADVEAPEPAAEEPSEASEDNERGGLFAALGFGRSRDADDDAPVGADDEVPVVAEVEGRQIVEEEPPAEIEPVVAARSEAQAIFPGDEDEAPAREPAPAETNQVASVVTPNFGSSSPSTFEVAPLEFDPATAPNACVNDLRVFRAHLQMPSASRFDLAKPVDAYVREAGGADTAINEVTARVDQLSLDLELELARRNPFNDQARRTSDDTIASLEDRILLNQALAEALECRR